jgi:hypothetical protein
MSHSHLISSCCNKLVITINSVFRPNDFTRAHIGSNCLLSHFIRGATGTVLPSVELTRIHIRSALHTIAPVVEKTQRLKGQSACVANKVDATAAR